VSARRRKAGADRSRRDRSIAEKEVYLGVQVQIRTMVDRGRTRGAAAAQDFPDAVDAELVAWAGTEAVAKVSARLVTGGGCGRPGDRAGGSAGRNA
jgi:hypothetical protein